MANRNPSDNELLEHIAEFCGWTDLHWEHGQLKGTSDGRGTNMLVPPYLTSVDAWLRDVWPKLKTDGWDQSNWLEQITEIMKIVENEFPQSNFPFSASACYMINLSARERCLALYRMHSYLEERQD